MKNLTLFCLICLVSIIACQNDNSKKFGETLEEKQRLLEEKKKELQDKHELEAVEQELKQIENELKGKNGNSTNSQQELPAPDRGKAIVTGDGVSIRSAPSTQGNKLGSCSKGESVNLLETRSVSGNNEAITTQSITLEGATFPKGKAVTIQSSNDGAGTYYISLDNNGITMYGTVQKNAVEVMEVATWHRIKTDAGVEGWIIGKFIKVN
jgi:hypothetical protein